MNTYYIHGHVPKTLLQRKRKEGGRVGKREGERRGKIRRGEPSIYYIYYLEQDFDTNLWEVGCSPGKKRIMDFQ